MPSTSNIAGALEAIEARLAANWNTTQVAYDNKLPPVQPWPPIVDTKPVPWVFCEIIDADADIVGFGKPGDQTVLDYGIIKLSVMVPKGSGLTTAREHATALGEIFRQQQFYKTDPTAYVRSMTPAVGRGDLISDDGNWVCGAACRIPFEFYHRA